MCGIVGYVGQEQVAPILLDGLAKLEYRGYDSAGIAVANASGIEVVKSKGRLQILDDMTDSGRAVAGTCGIGHTRWATHGEPSTVNAHPQYTKDRAIAVVHNGIIENYAEIKEFLLKKGYEFQSETDTEVVAVLLEYYYQENGQQDPLEAIIKMMNRVRGAYALGILFVDIPDTVFAVRKDSPLIVGRGETGTFIASDVPAILKYTRDVYYIDNLEIVRLTETDIDFFNMDLEPVEKQSTHIDWDVEAAEKSGYEHFMIKEIHEEPRAVRDTLGTCVREENGKLRLDMSAYGLSDEDLRSIDRLCIVACGSAYHAGMVAKYVIEDLARIPVDVDLASEFRYRRPILAPGTLVVIISQSGETLDSMAALREAKKRGARILSIVNVVGSSIARESHDVLYTWAGPEIAVATTKAYSTQMAVLNLLGLYFGDILGTVDLDTYTAMVRGIEALPHQMARILADTADIRAAAKELAGHEQIFFIGRNLDYALSLEGSLKLKEISYIHSEAYASGELKHGTISLIEEGTPVIAAATYMPLFDKAMSNVVEVQARGAHVLALTTESGAERMHSRVERVLTVPETETMLLPQLGVVPLQLLAYYIALERGCDIDKPRNLAKSVTVE